MLYNFQLVQFSDFDCLSVLFFYAYVEEKQKSIDIESICELLELVLGSQFPHQVDLFIQYLRVSLKTPCVLKQLIYLDDSKLSCFPFYTNKYEPCH